MTQAQKNLIIALRKQNLGYGIIATKLGFPRDRIRTFCLIHGLTERTPIDAPKEKIGTEVCKNCGKDLIHPSDKRKRKFCCNDCGSAWWALNQDKIKRKAFYHFNCAHCGKQFTSYGNANRKFCSRACSAASRRRPKQEAEQNE